MQASAVLVASLRSASPVALEPIGHTQLYPVSVVGKQTDNQTRRKYVVNNFRS